jgi:hypothetical protein
MGVVCDNGCPSISIPSPFVLKTLFSCWEPLQ